MSLRDAYAQAMFWAERISRDLIQLKANKADHRMRVPTHEREDNCKNFLGLMQLYKQESALP